MSCYVVDTFENWLTFVLQILTVRRSFGYSHIKQSVMREVLWLLCLNLAFKWMIVTILASTLNPKFCKCFLTLKASSAISVFWCHSGIFMSAQYIFQFTRLIFISTPIDFIASPVENLFLGFTPETFWKIDIFLVILALPTGILRQDVCLFGEPYTYLSISRVRALLLFF